MSSYRKIPDEFIKELLMRVDLVDLIDSHVPLKKTGANFVARCPFHTEKTPSFSVNRDKQLYHCFGCGASGNAISFLMAYSHLGFVEAVEDLAVFVGLPVPPLYTGDTRDIKQDLTAQFGLMAQVAVFFINHLRSGEEGKKAVAYLKKRGITGEIAKEFMLGYAPADWRALANSFDRQALLEVGMLIEKENGQIYDRFRGRLMFPIRDKRGRVVGFGGRVLDDGVPKYLNSPETPLFHKGQEVYGLYEMLQKNPKPKRILLVEGYMDVIALAGSGVGFAVAVLGTSVSQAHIQLLFRFTSELVLCFDGDNAGKEAAWRAIDCVFPSLKEGRRVRVMVLPIGQDPDSLVRAEGINMFMERINAAQVLSDYFFEQLRGNVANLAEVEGRAGIIGQAKPYLEKIPKGIYKDMMYEKLSGLAKFNHWANPEKGRAEDDPVNRPAVLRQQARFTDAPHSIQRRVLALLVQKPTLVKLIENREIDWDDLVFEGADKFKAIVQRIFEIKPPTTAILLEHYRGLPDEKIVRQLAQLQFQLEEGIDVEFEDAIDKLLDFNNKLKLEILLSKQKKGEKLDALDKAKLKRLLELTHKNKLRDSR